MPRSGRAPTMVDQIEVSNNLLDNNPAALEVCIAFQNAVLEKNLADRPASRNDKKAVTTLTLSEHQEDTALREILHDASNGDESVVFDCCKKAGIARLIPAQMTPSK